MQVNQTLLTNNITPLLSVQPVIGIHRPTDSVPLLRQPYCSDGETEVFGLFLSLTYDTHTRTHTLQSSQSSYIRQRFMIQQPRSTRSSSTLTLLRPSVTSSLKFFNHSIAI